MTMDQILARRTSTMCRQYATVHVIQPGNRFERLAMQQFLTNQGATVEGTKTNTNCILGTNTYSLQH